MSGVIKRLRPGIFSAILVAVVVVGLAPAVAQTVTSVSVPANGTYIIGQNLDFTVNVSTTVTVTGAPRIPVTLTSGTIEADYLSGSGTAALVFRATVSSGDYDADGITLGSAIDLNGGTIKDTGSNDLDTTLTGVGATSGILVDGVPPTVTSVSIPANGTYVAAENLDFTVNVSDTVTVTGTPRIPITLTSGTIEANYLSGSGTAALVFRATVSPGDNDLDGITLAGAIDLNGGTITGTDGNGLDTNLAGVPDTSGVLVDTIAPSVSSTGVPAPGIYGPGQNLDFIVRFDEAVIVTGTPVIPLVVGTSNVEATYVSGSGTDTLLFRCVVQSGDSDLDGISMGTAIVLNGGTITDPVAHPAELTLNGAGSTAAVYVGTGIEVPTLGGLGLFLMILCLAGASAVVLSRR